MLDDSPDTVSVSRRDFMTAVGTAAVGAGGLSATAGEAAAETTQSEAVLPEQPTNVEITFDRGVLEAVQPRLVTSHLEIKPERVAAYLANYRNESWAIACYWTEYIRQKGLLPTALPFKTDSHWGDHEPIIIRFQYDGTTVGDIQEVWYSGYHWIKATALPAGWSTDSGGRPLFHVFRPHHHYRLTTEVGRFPGLVDGTTTIPGWIDNGWTAIEQRTLGDPAVMSFRPDWWDHETHGEEAQMAKFWLDYGLGAADQTDAYSESFWSFL